MAGERVTWGCDAPADLAVFVTTCPRCAGRDPDCPSCRGDGTVDVHRCPSMAAAGCDDFLEAYCERVRCDTWPAPGGLWEQSAFFVAACRLADGERHRLDQEKRDAAAALGR